MLLLAILPSLLLATGATTTESARNRCDQPRAAQLWVCRQPWPIFVEGGVRALGFKPFPANPVGSLGTELGLYQKYFFRVAMGFDVGGFRQLQFTRGGFIDAKVLLRFVSRIGLYAELGVVVGGQVSSLTGTVYRADSQGRVRAARAPWLPAVRAGLAAGVGYDFGQTTRTPLRLFVRYRQLVQSPFMAGNDLGAMGLSALTFGFAVDIETLRKRNR